MSIRVPAPGRSYRLRAASSGRCSGQTTGGFTSSAGRQCTPSSPHKSGGCGRKEGYLSLGQRLQAGAGHGNCRSLETPSGWPARCGSSAVMSGSLPTSIRRSADGGLPSGLADALRGRYLLERSSDAGGWPRITSPVGPCAALGAAALAELRRPRWGWAWPVALASGGRRYGRAHWPGPHTPLAPWSHLRCAPCADG